MAKTKTAGPPGTHPEEDPSTTFMEPTRCPYCDYQMDAATAAFKPDASPKPGDVSVCMSCAQILQFDDNLKPAKVVVSDLRREMSEKGFSELMKVQRAVKALDRRNLPSQRMGNKQA